MLDIKRKEIIEKLLQQLDLLDTNGVCVALSGGLDSVVLLDIITKALLGTKYNLKTIHINHNLSPNAKEWVKHCKLVCERLGVEYESYSIIMQKQNRQSLEELAREKRYKVFAKALVDKEVLLTAHHRDDMAETFLLNALRGSGVSGLASIAPFRQFEGLNIIRPLLECSREELEKYAKDNKLEWIEDESNDDLSFRRNYLRHKIIPLLQNEFPGVSTCLARSAKLCATSNELCEDLAKLDLDVIEGDHYINYNIIVNHTFRRKANIVRLWLKKYALRAPSNAKLEEFLRQCEFAAEDKQPQLLVDNKLLRAYKGKIYLTRKDWLAGQLEAVTMLWQITLDEVETLPDNSTLTAIPVSKESYLAMNEIERKEIISLPDVVHIKFREGSDKHPVINGKKISLKEYCQENEVLPWLRAYLPLIHIDGEVVSIAGNINKKPDLNIKNQSLYKVLWKKSIRIPTLDEERAMAKKTSSENSLIFF